MRAADPNQEGGDQNIEVSRTWSDISLSPTALGPAGSADIESAVGGIEAVIKPESVETIEAATSAADAHLRELAANLITASGTSIGLPELRAGTTVTVEGMGARFDGTYRLTKATHAIGGSGYTTSFSCRKEVLGS